MKDRIELEKYSKNSIIINWIELPIGCQPSEHKLFDGSITLLEQFKKISIKIIEGEIELHLCTIKKNSFQDLTSPAEEIIKLSTIEDFWQLNYDNTKILRFILKTNKVVFDLEFC